MIRLFLTFLTLVSLLFFPWPFPVVIALVFSPFIPFLPLAAGLFADTLYYTPKTEALPLFTLYGALATSIALLVRSRLNAGIIKK